LIRKGRDLLIEPIYLNNNKNIVIIFIAIEYLVKNGIILSYKIFLRIDMKSLDKIDIDILSALYKNADITNKDLAELVDIATSTCQERVKRLKKQGVIRGYQCELDLEELSGHIEAMAAVKMVKHTEILADQLRDELLELPEVIQIFHMGGENDFNVHLTVYNMAHLRNLIFREFTSRSEVQNVETSLIFEHRRSSVLPKLSLQTKNN